MIRPVKVGDKFKSSKPIGYTNSVTGWQFGDIQGATVITVFAHRIIMQCNFAPEYQYEVTKRDFQRFNKYTK